MNKKTVLIILVVVFLVALFAVFKEKDESVSGVVPSEIDLTGVNFSKVGYITDLKPEIPNDGMVLVYEEPGAPALSASLVIDGQSVCTFGGQSIYCMALSSIIENTIGNDRVFVEGIRSGEKVVIRNISIDREEGRKFGMIKAVRKNGANFLVDVDEVEFLSGEEAVMAGIEDTDCSRDNIEDCLPSMNNNFYLRNKTNEIATYILTAEAKIMIFAEPGSPVLTGASPEEFATEFADPQSFMTAYPFKFLLDGASIVELEEQYMP